MGFSTIRSTCDRRGANGSHRHDSVAIGLVGLDFLHPEYAALAILVDPRHLRETGLLRIDEVVRQVHEEGLITHDRPRAKDRVAQPQGRGLADVDAARIRRHDAAHGGEQVALALRLELLLELVIGVEVVLDRSLRIAGDEHQLLRPSRERFLGRVLDQRLVDDRQHLLGAGLGRRKEAGATAGHREHGRSDLGHSQTWDDPWKERRNDSGSLPHHPKQKGSEAPRSEPRRIAPRCDSGRR